jgi:epoxyqueuosine reductase
MDRESLREQLRGRAIGLGFDLVAFVPAGPCRDADHLRDWIEQGHHADLDWMERTEAVRADPRRLLPEARTVVALASFYYTEPGPDDARWVGHVSRYAWGRDYHNVLGRRLRKLAAFANDLAPDARTVTAVDFRPVLEKEWAERAGLGWIGKHTNLITAKRGSWLFLSELVTQLGLAGEEQPVKERCGTCVSCLDACPTGAIVAPFRVDARRCISWLTIENEGPIPPELRSQVGEWIFGCDICQDVCPWNRFAMPVEDPAFSLDRTRFDGDLAGLLRLDQQEFLRRFEGSPVRRAGRDGLLRNVCVALGNRRDPRDLPALAEALHDPSALVRGHAAWAMGRLGGEEARRELERAGREENDAEALAEIRSALEAA